MYQQIAVTCGDHLEIYMNVRRYRAATMRAALEQAREELGADAMVLETREIKTGGVFGLGAKPMVELSVLEKEPENRDDTISGRLVQTSARPAVLPTKSRERQDIISLNLADQAETHSTKQRDHDFPAEKVKFEEPVSPKTVQRTVLDQQQKMRGSAPELKFADAEVNEISRQISRAMPEPLLAARQAETQPRKSSAKPNTAFFEEQWSGEDESQDAEIPRLLRSADTFREAVSALRESRNTIAAEPAPAAATAAPAERREKAQMIPEYRELFSRELSRMRAELRTEMRVMSSSLTTMVPQMAADSELRGKIKSSDNAVFPEESPYPETYQMLISCGLSSPLARQAVQAAAVGGLREIRDARTVARAGLAGALPALVSFADDLLTVSPAAPDAPIACVFVGPTGVGKTTTIAKLASRAACQMHRQVELITLDTWRIAAAEQLRTYAEIIGAGFHAVRSIRELDALVQRYARRATVLVDTAGSNPLDFDDGMELSEYLHEQPEMRRCLVLSATINTMDAEFALAQSEMCGADRLILTKLDETMRPGVAVGIAASSRLPLMYLCMGRRVPEDLKRATPLSFANSVVGLR
jgi:flagellar biosynthesis GTPase FlhF